MTALGLTLEYETGDGGMASFAVAFERLAEECERFGEFMFPRLVGALEDELSEQFDAEGHGPDGPWAPLSPEYAVTKEELYPGQPILRATGSLWHALTDSGSVNALREFDAKDFTFGTRGLEYASFHQTGTFRMPRRPPLDLRDSFERVLQREGAAAVREMVKAVGLEQAVQS